MSEHHATVEWKRSGEFRYETYSRSHTLRFERIVVPGSAAPGNIPATAVGVLDKTWISRVTLRPAVRFSGRIPSEAQHAALHHRAHEKCFVANSVKTEVIVEPCLK